MGKRRKTSCTRELTVRLDTYVEEARHSMRPSNQISQEAPATQKKATRTTEKDEIRELRAELAKIRDEIIRIREAYNECRAIKKKGVHYRKNVRVCYIPRKTLYDRVLEKLRESRDEPIKVTIKKVFIAAAKHLGVDGET